MTANKQQSANSLITPLLETGVAAQALWKDIVENQQQFVSNSINQTLEQFNKLMQVKHPQAAWQLQQEYFEQQTSQFAAFAEQLASSVQRVQTHYQQSFVPQGLKAKAEQTEQAKPVKKVITAKAAAKNPPTTTKSAARKAPIKKAVVKAKPITVEKKANSTPPATTPAKATLTQSPTPLTDSKINKPE